MKQTTIDKFKSSAFDYIWKGLMGIVLMIVNDMRGDIKDIIKIIPAHEVRISVLEGNRLIDRFKAMKNEDQITYDSLMQK